jgi:hypothetical protein
VGGPKREREILMIEKIAIAAIASAFSILLTIVLNMLLNPKAIKDVVHGVMRTHEEIWHKDSMYQYVELELKKHNEACPAPRSIRKVEKAVTFLFVKAGGELKDLDLGE